MAGLVCLWSPAHVWAGPPLLTDDPDTPGPNHWEINLAMTSEYEGHEWLLGAPLLDMNYGVGDHIQLKYQVPYTIDVPPQGGARAGLDNSLLGVKWRFLDQTNGCPVEVSIYPQYEFLYPASSVQRVEADNGNNILLPMEIEHIFKELTVYAEGGILLNSARPSEGWYGIAAQHDFTEKFSLMGEFYGGRGPNFMESGLTFNLGFSVGLVEHVALIGSAGRSIVGPRDGTPTFMSYLGLQFTF